MSIESTATMHMEIDFLKEGTKSPINIEYKAIPMLDFMDSGRPEAANIPAIVPIFQAAKAIEFRPKRNMGFSSISSLSEATVKVSSVIPKDKMDIHFFDSPFIILWDMDALIRK